MQIRRTIAAVAIAVVMAPFALSAQTVGDVQAQIQALLAQVRELQAQLLVLRQATSTPGVITSPLGRRICLAARTLQEGDSNDDVHALQEFLQSERWLAVQPTGFFGPLTREALARWQAQSGIVSEGDAATTGWGVFGPRTRVFIARWCGTPMTIQTPGGANALTTLTDTFRSIGATSTTQGNQPPVVANFSGPTMLAVNQTGTWTVSASDPEGQQLSYHVAWGDQNSAVESLLALADLTEFIATTTFTHAFPRSGLYAVTLRVRDGAGGVAGATRLVRVGEPASQPQTYLEWYSGLGDPGAICTADAYLCPSGQYVGRTGANCQFVCPSPSTSSQTQCESGLLADFYGSCGTPRTCTYNGQSYAENTTRTDQNACNDVESWQQISCTSPTYICRSGKWLQKATTFNKCTLGYNQIYAHGASSPYAAEQGDSIGLVSSVSANSVCYDGEWIINNSAKSCTYRGTTYANGAKAPCGGFIENVGTRYESCMASDDIWAYDNVCRNGSWHRERI